MKLSERFYEEFCERVMITHSNILTYGKICFLEGKLELVEDSGHETVQPMIKKFTDELKAIEKEYGLEKKQV